MNDLERKESKIRSRINSAKRGNEENSKINSPFGSPSKEKLE